VQKLDLLLINPSNRSQMYGALGSTLAAIEPPIWTGLIASFIREKGFSVKIIDADAEGWTPEYAAEKIIESMPLLVGVSAVGANPSASSTPKMASCSKILNILSHRAPGIKTFLYGIHPSALPERTLQEEPVDFICRGECFYTVAELLEILKSGEFREDYKINGLWHKKDGRIVSNGWGRLVNNIDELPFVSWDLLPMDKYRAHNWHCFGHLSQRQPYAVIYTSLGCPFSCSYCNISALYDGKPGIRFRSPKKVVEEIDYLVRNYKVKNIKILDEIFVLNENRVREFCDLVIQAGHNLNMWAYARVDTVNERILEKMKQAGINWLCFGIESASREVRDGVSKGAFNLEEIKKAVGMTHAAGICVMGNFMFGLPEDNLSTMQETLDLAKELNCEYVNFYTVMAYPGSRLYEEVLEKGIDLPLGWLGYSQLSEDVLPLPTRYLSAKEVLIFRDSAFEEYYSNPKYLKMLEDKFGQEAVLHIKEMLKHKIQRKLLIEKNA